MLLGFAELTEYNYFNNNFRTTHYLVISLSAYPCGPNISSSSCTWLSYWPISLIHGHSKIHLVQNKKKLSMASLISWVKCKSTKKSLIHLFIGINFGKFILTYGNLCTLLNLPTSYKPCCTYHLVTDLNVVVYLRYIMCHGGLKLCLGFDWW